MVCTRLRVFVIIFAEMLARQTEAGRWAAEGFSKPRKPFTGILFIMHAKLTLTLMCEKTKCMVLPHALSRPSPKCGLRKQNVQKLIHARSQIQAKEGKGSGFWFQVGVSQSVSF